MGPFSLGRRISTKAGWLKTLVGDGWMSNTALIYWMLVKGDDGQPWGGGGLKLPTLQEAPQKFLASNMIS